VKPYYWYARQPPPKRRGKTAAIVLGSLLALAAAAGGLFYYLRWPSAALPGLPLPRPAGWQGFDLRQGPPEALLWVEGPHSLSGAAELVCSPLSPSGLQIALRTGDPELPVIALRFPELAGEGALQGEVFLTGRGGTGALAGSTGRAELALRLRSRSVDGQGEILTGALKGAFGGGAGKGRFSARLHGCATFVPAAPIPWGRLDLPTPAGGSES
jgi:hypothetical protein